ncbi:MAG: MBL fold metallo-hydrolase [Syntrophomonadaceae bacterium]|nr:MBL fold metallo-hydrolase [Syntrophomonadaceae bacterium]
MELTVIGCWAPYPHTGGACSGYLIKCDNASILLDCGHSVFSHLGRYIDFSHLDAVFISHFHADHYVDLHALRHAIRGLGYAGINRPPLKVYLPGEPRDKFEYWAELPELQVFEVQEVSTRIKDIELSFYRAIHSIPGFAVKVTAGGVALFYSGDTAFDERLVEASAGVNLLLGEATMLGVEAEYAEKSGHMTARDLGIWAKIVSPDILIATHLWPGYTLKQIEEEIGSVYSGDFLLAHCGMNLNL